MNETVFAWIAQALAAMGGIVVRHGAHPATNGKVITLPHTISVPLDVALGWLVHEVGHIIDTSFEDWKQTPGRTLAMLNVVEDLRCDSRMYRRYRGAKMFRRTAITYVLGQGAWPEPEGPMAALQQYVLFAGYGAILSPELTGPLADRAKQYLIAGGFSPNALARVDAIIGEIPGLATTAAARVTAEQLLSLLPRDRREGQQEQQEQQGQSGARSGQNGQQQQQDQQSQTGGQPGQDGQQQQHDQQGQPAAQSGQNGQQQQETQDVDLNRRLGAMIEIEGGPDTRQLPPLPMVIRQNNGGASNGRHYAVLTRQAKRLTGHLHQLVQSKQDEPVRRVASGMVVSSKHLMTSQTNKDPRVFLRRTNIEKPNTTIHLLVDASGSMDGRPWTVATECAAALCVACENIEGVDVQVTAFKQDVLVPLVGRGETLQQVVGRLSACTPGGGTPTAEAIIWASAQMAVSEAKKKVLVVITDGQPNNPAAAKEALSVAKQQQPDLNIIGIGIAVDSISSWLRSSVVIQTVDDLSKVLFRLAEHIVAQD